MNIFELIIVASIIASGYLLGKFAGLYYGPVGFVAGFLGGSFLAILIWYLIRVLLSRLLALPPSCRNGKCIFNNRDYKFIGFKSKGKRIWRCRCGTEYLEYRSFFKEILPDGSLKPYMKKSILGRWRLDDSK